MARNIAIASNGVPQLGTSQEGFPESEARISLPENHSRSSPEKQRNTRQSLAIARTVEAAGVLS